MGGRRAARPYTLGVYDTPGFKGPALAIRQAPAA